MRALVCYGATERNGGRDEARRGLAECRRFIRSNTRAARPRRRRAARVVHRVRRDDRRGGGALPRARRRAARARRRGRRRRRGRAGTRLRGPARRVSTRWTRCPGIDPRARRAPDRGRRRAAPPSGAAGSCRTRGRTAATAWATRARSRRARASRSAPTATPPTWPTSSTRSLEIGRCARRRRAGGRARGSSAGRRLAADCLGARPGAGAGRRPRRRRRVRAGARSAACSARLVVDGRVVMENGRLLTGDVDAIRADARREAERLWRRMGEVEP